MHVDSVHVRGVMQSYLMANLLLTKLQMWYLPVIMDGIIDITETDNARICCMVAGLEMVRMLDEYTDKYLASMSSSHKHPEKYAASRKKLFSTIRDAIQAFEDVGSPFQDGSADLIV